MSDLSPHATNLLRKAQGLSAILPPPLRLEHLLAFGLVRSMVKEAVKS